MYLGAGDRGRRRGEVGRPARVELAVVDRMMNLTGLPLAVAALMLGRGEIRRPGVIAPEAEGGPDPDRFLNELAARGVAVHMGAVEYEEAPRSRETSAGRVAP